MSPASLSISTPCWGKMEIWLITYLLSIFCSLLNIFFPRPLAIKLLRSENVPPSHTCCIWRIFVLILKNFIQCILITFITGNWSMLFWFYILMHTFNFNHMTWFCVLDALKWKPIKLINSEPYYLCFAIEHTLPTFPSWIGWPPQRDTLPLDWV